MRDLPEFALSIRQPWAWAIIHAGKDVENRNWSTKYRGPVAIHAAKGMTEREFMHAMVVIDRACPVQLHERRRGEAYLQTSQARGGIIGVAEVIDCVTSSPSPWFFGPHGFVLRNARPVPFIPCRGALRFFRWSSQ